MKSSTVFDRLVSNLSSDERREMLERVRQAATVEEEPLVTVESREPVDYEQVYHYMSFFRKVFLFLASVLTGRSRDDLVGEYVLHNLASQITSRYPALVDISKRQFLPGFFREIKTLQQAATFFAPACSRALGAEKAEFMAFLLGLESPETQQKLLEDTDPFSVGARESELPEFQLKKLLFRNLDDVLSFVPLHNRERMYRNAQLLHALYLLSTFPYGSLLLPFTGGAGGSPTAEGAEELVPCSVYQIKDHLLRLAAILRSLNEGPTQELSEAVFLFQRQSEQEGEDRELETELQKKVSAARTHFGAIRRFARDVPIFDIVRYVVGDVNYRVEPAGGGEDWLALIKRFWGDRIERLFAAFQFQRQKDELLAEAGELTGAGTVVPMGRYPSAGSGSGGKHAASLGVLAEIVSRVYQSHMHAPLKVLLIDGEFYKEDNRTEFTTAFDALNDMPERLRVLRGRLTPDGQYGVELKKIAAEKMPPQARLQRRAAVVERIDEEADEMVQDALAALRSISEVLYGILYGEVGGKYDTLSNIGEIGGRSNKSLMKQFDTVMNRAQKSLDLLGKLYDVENASSRRQTVVESL